MSTQLTYLPILEKYGKLLKKQKKAEPISTFNQLKNKLSY
tara:strand:+ start:53967 stop:54086 length:120 start_codon:yes stop_codon:yes gene_type:complete